MIWRDITQIDAPGCVLFSADTPAAGVWMTKWYRRDSVAFQLPRDHASALAFKEAAESAEFVILAFMRRAPGVS